MKEQIEFTIDKDGNVTLHVHGVQGKSCQDLTKSIEEAIGTVTERRFHGEAYEQPKLPVGRYANRGRS